MQTELRQLLEDQGYCVASGILDHRIIENLLQWSNGVVSEISSEHRENNKSQGSLINLSDYPDFSEIIGHSALLELFKTLHFPNPIFSSGYLISKSPHSPALFWHQDWWGWDDPLSYTKDISQVFIMIYLTDTTPEKGCLRVIPGSHRQRHPLHEATLAHTEILSKVENPDDPLYHSWERELAVSVKRGDVVVGDARLLHSSFPNDSDQERTLLTLWYHPNFLELPAGMKARIQEIFFRRGVDTDQDGAEQMIMTNWPTEAKQKIEKLLPRYDGKTPPHAWNRQPDLSLLSS